MHYIRLVVLGDSQVGKTSLIKQLIGQEHKFEPELRTLAQLEREQRHLDKQWLALLRRHERRLEQAVESERLATLLRRQMELQQLLLDQRRPPAAASSRPIDCERPAAARCTPARKSLPSVSAAAPERNDCEEQLQPGEPAPTILISAEPPSRASNESLAAPGVQRSPRDTCEAADSQRKLSETSLRQHSLIVSQAARQQAVASGSNSGGAHSTGSSDRLSQHRHSYCGSPSGDSPPGSADKQAAAELSAQARIINILFTRSSGSSCAGAGAQEEPAASNSKRPLLMPSLLRQYQRRLSNFHVASSQAASTSGGGGGGGSASGGSGSVSGRRSQEQVAAEARATERGARAAAGLATAAASAAQALLLDRTQPGTCQTAASVDISRQLPVPHRRLPATPNHLQEPRLAGAGAQYDWPGQQPAAQANLYSLTQDYRARLGASLQQASVRGQRHRPTGAGSASTPTAAASSEKINHFHVSYVNERQLYEIQIVDMPAIEPPSFPASSLREWSLFKGRSHLLTADAYLLVFDLTRPQTIEYIKSLRDKIFESREMSSVPVYVIANKADLCPTLQPSLQARRLRNVASMRQQEQLQQQQQQQQQQLQQQQQQQTTTAKGSKSGAGSAKMHTGSKAARSMPAAAARQLLAAYRAQRVRLGSKTSLITRRRWARLRRTFVGPAGSGFEAPPSGLGSQPPPGVHGAPGGVGGGSQWLQFQERSRYHRSLILGAAGADTFGHQWSHSFGLAFAQLKSLVRRDRRRPASGAGSHRYPAGLGGASRRQSYAAAATAATTGGSHRRRRGEWRAHQRRKSRQLEPSPETQQKIKKSPFFRRLFSRAPPKSGHACEPPTSGLRSRKRKKAAAGELVESQAGSKTDSLRSSGGLKQRRQRNESNFQHYSRLLTLGRKQATGAATAPGGGVAQDPAQETNNQQGAPVAVAPVQLVEPVCGQLSTPSYRQSFYELFNKLLCTSSTTAAKTQLKMNGLGSFGSHSISGGGGGGSTSQRHQVQADKLVKPSSTGDPTSVTCKTSFAAKAPRLLMESGGVGLGHLSKKERRKSSSTGAALWQTISSYALKGHRNSSAHQSAMLAGGAGAASTPAPQQAASGSRRGTLEQVQATSGNPAASGVHLGADQYLSVDMLRKLSLVSANSQMSGCLLEEAGSGGQLEGAAEGGSSSKLAASDKDEPLVAGSLMELARRASRAHSAAGDRKSSSQQEEQSEAAAAAAAAGKRNTSAKGIWYRGVVKKILFHSNKHSIRGLVTAMELQRRAEELAAAADSSDPQTATRAAPALSESSGPAPAPPEALDCTPTQTDQAPEEEPPSIRIISSGSRGSFAAGNAGQRSSEPREDACQDRMNLEAAAAAAGGALKSNGSAQVIDGPRQRPAAWTAEGAGEQQTEPAQSGQPLGEGAQARSVSSLLSMSSYSESVSLGGLCSPSSGAPEPVSSRPATAEARAPTKTARSGEQHASRRCRSALDRKRAADSSGQPTIAVRTPTTEQSSDQEEPQSPPPPPPLVPLVPLAASCSLRKLSADDCLIINRQRRKSLAEAGAGHCQAAQTAAASGDGWLAGSGCAAAAAAMGGRRESRSACGNYWAGAGAAGGGTCRAGSPPADADSDDPERQARRQSIKQSIEAALHLLVPRAKSNRSASITLGAADPRGPGAVQASIMGAVNVQRSWRDWRQLLGRRRGAPRATSGGSDAAASTAEPDFSLKTGGGANEAAPLGDFGQAKEPGAGSGPAAQSQSQWAAREGPAASSPVLRFLRHQAAFRELSGEQQLEAAINFDQLMRINQLTLSAANQVMQEAAVGAGDAGADPQAPMLTCGSPPGASSSALASMSAPQGATAKSVLEMDAAAMELAAGSAEEPAARLGPANQVRPQHRPLITRLQSGGNLLLKRSSTRRRISSSNSAVNPLEAPRWTDSLGASATEGPLPAHQNDSLDEQELLMQESPREPGQFKLAGASSGGQVSHEYEVAAKIAAAAASALEKQKSRAEALSLILEPRYDKKQPGAQYPLFVSHDLNPILKDLAQLVRKHWKCNYIECSAHSNWNIKPIISELTRALQCNHLLEPAEVSPADSDQMLYRTGSSDTCSSTGSSSSSSSAGSESEYDDRDEPEDSRADSRDSRDSRADGSATSAGVRPDSVANSDRKRPRKQRRRPSLAARLLLQPARRLSSATGAGSAHAGGARGPEVGPSKRRRLQAAPNTQHPRQQAACALM